MSRRKKDEPNEAAAAAVQTEAPAAVEENGTPKKGPVWKVSVPVSRTEYVNVSVWENQGGNADNQFTVYAVQLEVRYKVGEEWRSGKSLRGSMLPAASWALGKAYDWIMTKRADLPF